VEICKTCAQAKNVCQVCIYDLQYGLPVKVRDRILRETAEEGGGGVSAAALAAAVPQSLANRSWFAAQQERALEQQGQNGSIVAAATSANALAHAKLQDMANMEPRYERNLPKLCSFFARGECDRGDTCPFRHEMPRDRNDPMSKQNTRDRFYGTSDPVANKILGRQRRREEQQEHKQKQMEEGEGYDKARATLYVRLQGDEPFPNMTEVEIRDLFYAFGEIISVRVQPERGQAFVEYTQPEAAELAIATMNRKTLLGRSLFVAWARAPKRGEASSGGKSMEGDGGASNTAQTPSSSSAPSVVHPLPPPGGVTKIALPSGLTPARPDMVVVAAIAPVISKTGGGPIRGVGGGAAKRVIGSTQPYYPSADPKRLGSQS
jgi:pre-mRNA-splicing factor RBM22/SLT11